MMCLNTVGFVVVKDRLCADVLNITHIFQALRRDIMYECPLHASLRPTWPVSFCIATHLKFCRPLLLVCCALDYIAETF